LADPDQSGWGHLKSEVTVFDKNHIQDPNHILGDPRFRQEQLILEAAWRFQLIAPLLNGLYSGRQKELFRREVLKQKHTHPWRGDVSVSARTLRRWCQHYRESRLSGLTLHVRRDRGQSRKLPAGALDLAAQLVAEDPRRGPTGLIDLLVGLRPDWLDKIARSTLDRHMRAEGLAFGGRRIPEIYGTFVAQSPDDMWQGDICHGPLVLVDGKERVAKIVTWIDDHSRFILHIEAFPNEKLPAIEAALTRAILKHGVPLRLLVDNGKVYSGKSFTLACSQLGIHKIHSTAYHPESKGKQERFYRSLRGQLLNEMENVPPGPIETLNRLLLAWTERYHDTPHGGLKNSPGQGNDTPRQRYKPAHYRPVTYELLEEAFLQWDTRKVSPQGKITFAGQTYCVDPSLAHQPVIVRYDPFDIRRIFIWKDGRKLAEAGPETLLHRSKPRKPKPEESQRSEAAERYLKSLEQSHQERLEREMNLIELPAQEDE
jgi:putative transposase